MKPDPRAQVPSAALDLLEAGGQPDTEAVRAAWEAPGRRTHPEAPAAPGRAGSVALEPAGGDGGREAKAWAVADAVIDAYVRVKTSWRVPLDRRIETAAPRRFARWAPPRCAQPGCRWGWVEADEDGSTVAPCPSCRPVREDAAP